MNTILHKKLHPITNRVQNPQQKAIYFFPSPKEEGLGVRSKKLHYVTNRIQNQNINSHKFFKPLIFNNMQQLLLNLNIRLELLSFANECIKAARSENYQDGDLQVKAGEYAESILELLKRGANHAENH